MLVQRNEWCAAHVCRAVACRDQAVADGLFFCDFAHWETFDLQLNGALGGWSGHPGAFAVGSVRCVSSTWLVTNLWTEAWKTNKLPGLAALNLLIKFA